MKKKKAHLPTLGILAMVALAITVIVHNVEDASYLMSQTRNAVEIRSTLNSADSLEVRHVRDGVHTGDLPNVIINRYGYNPDAPGTSSEEENNYAFDSEDTQDPAEETRMSSQSNLEFLGIDVGNIESRVTDTSFVQTQETVSEEDQTGEEDLVVGEIINTEETGQVLGVEDVQDNQIRNDQEGVIYVDESIDARDLFQEDTDTGTYREYHPDEEVYDYCESEDCAF